MASDHTSVAARSRKVRTDDGGKVARRVLQEWLITAVASVVIVIVLLTGNLTSRADNLVYDALSRIQSAKASQDIVVIAIDNRSLESLGPWPWPRDIHARLIERLHQARTGPVAYDVLFMEATPDDAALSSAMAKAGNIYLPALIGAPGPNGASWFTNLPAGDLATSAAGLGHVMLTPDDDGTLRHLPLWLSTPDRIYGHLTLPLAQSRIDGQAVSPPATSPTDGLLAEQTRLIRYPTDSHGYRLVSFIDVLNGEIADGFLKDRLVLVGGTAHGMGDRYATTTSDNSELVPGVLIQAALLQTLIQQNDVKPVPGSVRLFLSALPLLLMLAGFLLLRPTTNTFLGVGLLLACIATSFAAYAVGWWWPPVAAMAGVMIAWPLWSWRRLAAVYGYMQTEMANLDRDRGGDRPGLQLAPLSRTPAWHSGDEISRQIHALNLTMKQVRDFNNFISQSVRSLPDAAVITDTAGKVLVANNRARDLFANTALEQKPLSYLFAHLGQTDWQDFLDENINGHDDILTPDGRALQVATAALTDAEGHRAGHIIRFADVTALRASERQRERTLQLLGHDMRAPQVSIIALLDNPSPPRNVLERIRANASQTLELAEAYVQLSRAENQILRLQTTDLGQLLTEAADTLWPQAAAKGVNLSSPDIEVEYLVHADSALLRRALINLIDNAIRHTPTGSRVICDLLSHDGQITIMIADEGPGFDADTRSGMFQPYQGGKIAGAGLGLSFVGTVIQRHGGQIGLTPPKGIPNHWDGTCFYITLAQTRDGVQDA